MLFLITVIFSLHPLFSSFSRGAFLAAFSCLIFYGILKKRILLVLAIIVFIFWQTLLPKAVVNRINMTVTGEGKIEHSADSRTHLWKLAFDIFSDNPLWGVGYGGYSLMTGGQTLQSGETLAEQQDAHSIYMRILCEQGLIGMILLLLVFFMSFRSAFQLYRIGQSPLLSGLGFGFMGCVLAYMITNLFGDRWSYFTTGGYFWILWGLVDRCILNTRISNTSQ